LHSANVTRDLWRISNYKSLTGEGALKYAARWHSAGRRIVYLAESPAGAMIEVLVHLELEEDELPYSYMLLHVEVPDDLAIEQIKIPAGDAWKSNHALSRRLGDEWLQRNETALARVPSVILPNTSNYLLNPLHADAKRVRIMDVKRAEFESRLLKHLRG
jgi:RES domain-containing protein